jgi:arginase family enzyme
MFIVKVPGINGLGKTKGCEKAGNAVIKALNEIYSNEEGKPINTKLLDLEEIHLDNSDLELTNKLIGKNSLEMFQTKPRTIFIGGDHSISFSLTKSFLEYCKKEKKKPYLIIFDAHPDCMEPAHKNYPTHEDWLRSLIESGFPSQNILLIGSRNADQNEIIFMKEHKIKTIPMNNLLEDLQGIGDTITEFSNGNELYVSMDIDIIDPAFAPGTGYIEPGGLTSRQFIYLVQRINRVKNLRALDLVEINPEKDEKGFTVKLGAKILSELI